MLENLPADTLPRLLRRTAVSALIVGGIGFLVAMLLAPAQAALGEAAGVGLAVMNLRFLDRQSARVELAGETNVKAVRRQLRGKTSARLLAVTAVVLVLVFLDPPLGIGIVAGLVIYQVVFVANVFRVVVGQGGVE